MMKNELLLEIQKDKIYKISELLIQMGIALNHYECRNLLIGGLIRVDGVIQFTDKHIKNFSEIVVGNEIYSLVINSNGELTVN